MALSCAAIRRDSVSLLRFPFFSQVQVFWCEMLFIRRLKRSYSCFPSHFCFLVLVILSFIVLSVSTLMVVISPHSCFSMSSSSHCIDALLLFYSSQIFLTSFYQRLSLESKKQQLSSCLQHLFKYPS